MATIPKHTEISIAKYDIKDEETKKDIYLIHEFIDRIKYIGPSLILRALSHNTWFVNHLLPLYIEWCPLVSPKGKTTNKSFLMQVGTDHLHDDFRGNILNVGDIFNTNAVPDINRKLSKMRHEKELKEIVTALIDSGIAYILLGYNGFISTYILHGLLAINPECHNKNIYIFVKRLKQAAGDVDIGLNDIALYMKEEIPHLNNGFTFKLKSNEHCGANH